jgi:hypothetical protein
MSRYPQNGRLLLLYGRFLEDVQHDPWAAAKYYSESDRVGVSDTMLNLTRTGGKEAGGDSGAGLLESIDEKNDALIVINGTGVIMMINQVRGAGPAAARLLPGGSVDGPGRSAACLPTRLLCPPLPPAPDFNSPRFRPSSACSLPWPPLATPRARLRGRT